MSTEAGSTVAWPPDRFFWAVLDAPGWRRGGPIPEGLRVAMADELPVSVDRVHAIGAPLESGRVLVCAALRGDLELIGPEILAVVPGALPEFAAGSVEPGLLNLLVGEFEPARVRRARARAHTLTTMTILGVAVLVSTGLQRRANADRVDAECTRGSIDSLRAGVLPGSDAEAATEIDRLERVLAAHVTGGGRLDAAETLAAVLAGWPNEVAATVHSIAVGPQGASLSLTLTSDPTPFLTALRPPKGWGIDEPQLNANERGTRLSVRLRPRDPGVQGQ